MCHHPILHKLPVYCHRGQRCSWTGTIIPTRELKWPTKYVGFLGNFEALKRVFRIFSYVKVRNLIIITQDLKTLE
jgi:hypothetical protein